MDLSHANTSCKVTAHAPESKEDTATIDRALKDCDVVVIPAGVPRKPGMTRDDLFKINAGILAGTCEAIARVRTLLRPLNAPKICLSIAHVQQQ